MYIFPQANVPNKFDIKVKRNNILEDAFAIISQVNRVDLLRTKLWIEFDGEVSSLPASFHFGK